MLFRFLFVLLPLILLSGYYTLFLSPEDIRAYEDLVQKSLDLRTRHTLEDAPAIQEREEVRKDIWKEKHLSLGSSKSKLTISYSKGKIEAEEILEGVSGSLEDGFFFQGDKGLYSHQTQEFLLEGNCLFSKNENFIHSPSCKIKGTEAIVSFLEPEGHLENGSVDFSAKELVWDKKKEKLYLKNGVKIKSLSKASNDAGGRKIDGCPTPAETDSSSCFGITLGIDITVLANEATIDFKGFETQEIIFSDAVKLFSPDIYGKESFALGDTLFFDPKTKTIILNSDKKVLFWQEGLSLSAPEIRVHQDKTIEAIGDVHFDFDLEEKNSIDQFFKAYL